MNKTLKNIIMLWLCVMLLGTLAFSMLFAEAAKTDDFSDNPSVKEYKAKIAEYEKQQKELKSDLSKVQSELNDAKQQIHNLDSLMTANHNLYDATNTLIGEYELQIAAKEEQIAEVSSTIADLQAEMESTHEQFLTFIRVQYEHGTPSMLEAIYDADGLGDMLSRMEYVGRLMEYNTNLLDKYTAEKESYDTLKAGYEATLAELNTARDEQALYAESLSEIENELEAQLSEQQKLLKEISAEEKQIKEEYERLREAEEEESQRLEELINKLTAESKGSYIGGEMGWPVDTSIKRISSYYGNRTYYYKGRRVSDFHRGIDIPSAVGTNIYSAQDGEVIYVYPNHASYGNYIIVDHGGGITTLYAHCSSIIAKKGDKVKKGDHIAEMGSTGQSTGSHLHFEVRVNGQHTNPLGNTGSPSGGAWIIQPK